MAEITLIEAINQALRYEMTSDENVILLGQDIGINGGVFRATQGLFEKFGGDRVLDTPLAESMIAGVSIGMATQGFKPVAEFQFMGFSYPALDQIINHAARIRNRTRGRFHCPVVFRMPYGAGIHAPEHHSESTEAIFAHIPGLRVIVPSSPARAYGLLLAAIRDPDPIIFLEPTRLYRLNKQKVPDTGNALPLDRSFLIREGNDITLISWGAMLHETLIAADLLLKKGLSADIIDVATLKPLDCDTFLSSVEKTGRCVIIHEAARFGGVGAEIATQLSEKGFFSLRAPIQRVTGYDVTVPYAQLEKFFLPSLTKILNAIDQTLEFT
jgi:2-oxoisovalerate dehydrogenase E1 component beta subunit